jgi:hypothetical protein
VQRPQRAYSLIEHRSGFSEWCSFQDPHPTISFETLEPGQTTRDGCVIVQKEDHRLRVRWHYTPEDAGMPLRPTKKKDIFELGLNQWGRVIYNGRFSEEEGGWWYNKTVLNIGLFEEVAASVFVETIPDLVMNKTARLY